MQHQETHMTSLQYAQRIASFLQDVQQECRLDADLVDDTTARVMFEAVAGRLGETMKILEDYLNTREMRSRGSGFGKRLSTGPLPPTRSDLAVDVDAAEPPPPLRSELPRQ